MHPFVFILTLMLCWWSSDAFLSTNRLNLPSTRPIAARTVPAQNVLVQRSHAVVLQANPRRIEFGDGQNVNHAKEMLKHTLLTAQDEFQLAREYKVGMQIQAQFKVLEEQLGRYVSDADVAQSLDIDEAQVRSLLERMENAKSVLTGANMRLVFHIARYYKFRGVAYPDLVQEGTFGLIKAIQKYDPDRGFRFSTYASWWIKQSVSRAIAEKSRLIRLPVHIHDMMVSISKVEREFSVQHSRKPTPQEVAQRLALPLPKVELLMRCAQEVSSIDENAFQNRGKAEVGGVQVKEKIASQTSVEPSTLSTRNSLRAELRRAMGVLSEREAQVLELRFGLSGDVPMTLEDIGKLFSVTRERIRQIEARALSKMRHPSKKSELEEIFHEHSGGSAGAAGDYPFPSAALSGVPLGVGVGREEAVVG